MPPLSSGSAMPAADWTWSQQVERTLESYDETLLRQVASKLFRPRSQWPVEELLVRSLATLENAAAIDRRLQDLPPVSRQLLTLMAHSRQPCWRLGSLVELGVFLGADDPLAPIFALFEIGLLYPELHGLPEGEAGTPRNGKPRGPRLRSFEQWLGQANATGFQVFGHPDVLARALPLPLALPACPVVTANGASAREADGLEWLLRLAVVWQQLANGSFRLTQQGDFFKRDLDRLRTDPMLSGSADDQLAELPDAALLAVALAQHQGVAKVIESEVHQGSLPPAWDEGLASALSAIWTRLPSLDCWNPQEGWCGGTEHGNPFASAGLLLLVQLATMPADAWARPADLEEWLHSHHPYWKEESVRPSKKEPWVARYLLGLMYPLRFLQATRDAAGDWVVRLSALGRWLLGQEGRPPTPSAFPQTLMVQPNLEIIAYRQGLTPALISRLSRFAAWKTLGSACTLQLTADTIYRGLESGATFESILQTLEQHGMRAIPTAVVESLRTWAVKRERITVFPSATLLEFASVEELNEALGRGVPGIRISDRLLAVASENDIDFRHFRLTGTRDYSLPAEKCVAVEADGVTLAIDVTTSDLLLETELARFAESLDGSAVSGQRRYRLTPASLQSARRSGLSQSELEDWFVQRTGQALPAAARLLLCGAQAGTPELQPALVLRVPTPEIADGLVQWPGTRSLIEERLGPTALVVAPENIPVLRERLEMIGIPLPEQPAGPSSPSST